MKTHLVSAFLLLTTLSTAQRIDIDHFVLIDSEKGMSNSWVSSITQGPKGYMWLATQNGINRYDGHQFIWYQRDKNDPNSLNSNWVRNLKFLDNGDLLYSGHASGLGIYNSSEQQFTNPGILGHLEQLGVNYTYFPAFDSLGQCWISSQDQLLRISIAQNRLDSIPIRSSTSTLVIVDTVIWMFSDQGIHSYGIQSLQKIDSFAFNDPAYKAIYFKGNFYISSDLKIIRWNQKILDTIPIRTFVSSFYLDRNSLFAISTHKILRIHEDNQLTVVLDAAEIPNKPVFNDIYFTKDGQRWIATSKGVWIENSWRQKILSNHQYQYPILQTARGICVDGDKIYLATNNGLELYEKGRLIKNWNQDRVFQSVTKYRDQYWAGNNAHAVYRLSPDGTIKKIYFLGNHEFNNSIYSIASDSIHGLVACTWDGLFKYNESLDEFELIKFDSITYNNPIGLLHSTFDRKGNLWVTTNGHGILKVQFTDSLNSNKVRVRQFKSSADNSISSDVAMCILEDNQENIWIGTDVGINVLNSEGEVIKSLSRKEGLVDEKIVSMEQDKLGRFWFGTIGHGLYLYYPKNESFLNFTKDDGLISNNFYFKSSFQTKDGYLFFGTDEGIQVIDPMAVDIEMKEYNLQFTQVKYYSKKKEQQIILTDGLDISKPLRLMHNENDIQISFAAIEYNIGNKIHYEYAWTDDPDHWVPLGTNKEITLSGLAPNKYGLNIRALVPGLQNYSISPTFHFIIQKPWYATFLAFCIYLAMISGIIIWIYRLQIQRKLAKHEAETAKHLNQVKNQLLTYIAHELKTPLTLIQGSVDFILNRISTISTHHLHERLQLLDDYSNQLSKLVHDVLRLKENDISVTQNQPENIEIIEYTQYIISSFESWAHLKSITLSWNCHIASLWMPMDKEKYFHILTNILSNAIKYTEHGGRIEINPTISTTSFQLEINDNGIGYFSDEKIPDDIRESSHGLGLQIVRNLLKVMDGHLSIKQNQPRGTIMILSFPITQSLYPVQEIAPQKNALALEEETQILLVEDNLDIRLHIEQILSNSFEILHATNGAQGLQIARERIPDIIISDVMMPEMDGLEMATKIKSDPATSHIPIIILSAKDRVQDRVEGYKLGADQYLGKPFHEKELRQIIQALLRQRQKLADYFVHHQKLVEAPIRTTEAISAFDKKFLEDLNDFILEHISDPQLSIEQICQHIFLSRSQLHRKLVAMTGLSITKYLNTIRIQQAQILLKNREQQVNQVAYDVGFSDPAYFSKVFKKITQVSPSEYRMQ